MKAKEKGQGLVEYALILVLVTVVVLVILALVGPSVNNIFHPKIERHMLATYCYNDDQVCTKVDSVVSDKVASCEPTIVYGDQTYDLKSCNFENRVK